MRGLVSRTRWPLFRQRSLKREVAMKSRDVLHKLEHIAEDIGKKTRAFASAGTEKIMAGVRKGRKSTDERKTQ